MIAAARSLLVGLYEGQSDLVIGSRCSSLKRTMLIKLFLHDSDSDAALREERTKDMETIRVSNEALDRN